MPAITKRLAPVSRLDSSTQLRLTIGLPLQNREKLTNLLEELSDPSSPNFRQFLTAGQFSAAFGPSEADYQAVINFAKAHGLAVRGTHPNRTLVDVSGSAADIETTFHVRMQVYQHPTEARTFFAPDGEPSLDLATPVLAVSGLNNYVRPHPHIHPARPNVRPLGGGGGGGGSGGGGNTGPFEGYDFRTAYAPGVSQDGSGQSVGLFELFGFNPQDITDYEDEVGIYPYVNVLPVPVDGGPGSSADADYLDYPGYLDYAMEVTGDIEMAIAMAPGLSNVLVYEGPTPQDVPPLGSSYIQDATTTAQINDVLNRMATDDQAQQLSCSYGFDINLSTVQIFQQYAVQGQSFFLASGDSGAYPAAIDEPADDPYLTVVGGTTLTTTSAGSWASETTWLTPASTDEFGDYTPLEASGGGISLTYGIPTWQQGISMTANQGSTTMRNLPDVASVANNITIVWGNDLLGSSMDWPEGGTSLAAPLWAAFLALVNEQGAANGQPPVGFANPALYAIGKSTNYQACFHDIATGNNMSPDSPTKFSATAGYDLCTGWGTIAGANLIQALLAPPVDSLRITPPLGFTSFGPGGGPFTVSSQIYTLTNTGLKSLKWSLVSTSRWLNVSASAGTLNPGGPSATVTVSLDALATNLLIASCSGNVSFANLTTGTAQNRQFNLYAGNGGFETGDFTDWTYVGDATLSFTLAGDDVDVAGTNALPGEADELFVHSGIYGAYLGEWALDGDPAVGSLSQTVATTAGQQLLVSFWLTTVPYEGETTPNDFVAKWNGSPLYAGTNLPAFGWANLQFAVSATGAKSTLEFDFNNVPGAFGLDDVMVASLPAPVLQTAAVGKGTINFSWSTIANVSYQVQSAANLSKPIWANVGGPIPGTGGIVSVSEPISAGTQRYYQVITVLPP